MIPMQDGSPASLRAFVVLDAIVHAMPLDDFPRRRHREDRHSNADKVARKPRQIRRDKISTDNADELAGAVCFAVPARGPNGNVIAGVVASAAQTRLTPAQATRFLPEKREAAGRRSRNVLAGVGDESMTR